MVTFELRPSATDAGCSRQVITRVCAAIFLGLSFVSCSSDEGGIASTPSPLVTNDRSIEPQRPSEPGYERGELLSYACQACHTLEPGGVNQVGPNLNGIFGRAAASVPDFSYSDALLASGIDWSPQELDAWLAAPDDFLPGNNMPFAGYANPDDRADLLAYLVLATAPSP